MSGRDTGTLAGVYADALAGAADARGLLAQVGEELEGFAALWSRDADVRNFFLSGAIGRDAKAKALDAVTVGKTSETFSSFLQVLLQRARLWALPETAGAYRKILDRRLGRVPVALATAAPVSPADLEAWRARLAAALGKEPVLTHEVKPALIGGAVLRVGDTVADGSVRRRLLDLRSRFAKAARL
ncbi:MAG: ATP synthase F1 subunit delta [Planctomycetota bacterium]